MLLHWLASQPLYLVSLKVYDFRGKPVAMGKHGQAVNNDGHGGLGACGDRGIYCDDSGNSTFPGHSNELSRIGCPCFGIILAVSIEALLMIDSFWDDTRRLRPCMQLVTTRSHQISAACHSLPYDDAEDLVEKPITWGIVTQTQDGVFICTFTNTLDTVESPRAGDHIVYQQQDRSHGTFNTNQGWFHEIG